MDDLTYRRLPRIANSDLSELLAIKTGKSLQKADPKTLQFGTTAHQLILEPEKPVDWTPHDVKEQYKLMEASSVWTGLLGDLGKAFGYPWHLVERVTLGYDQETGLGLKGKIDALTNRHLIDLKTTSCESSQEFFDCFVEYGYDRQAAFYLDLMPGYGYDFVFIGVQKCKPFEVFIIDMTVSQDRRNMIDEGRRKNRRLLRAAKEELDDPDGWRPSSWSR